MNASFFNNFSYNNINFLEEMYEKFLESPHEIDPEYQKLFESLSNSKEEFLKQETQKISVTSSSAEEQSELKIAALINAYRTYGHLLAKIDPVRIDPIEMPWELELDSLGFEKEELDKLYPTCGILEKSVAPLSEIIQSLQKIYCGNIGIEYMGAQNPNLEKWVQQEIEPTFFKPKLTIDQKKMILQLLNKSELFESFLHTKYVGQKRFSLEGGETLIPILAAAIEIGGDYGVETFVIGMAHRGRLNVLSNILEKSYEVIFSEFEDRWMPNTFEGSGDVKYHKGFVATVETLKQKKVDLILAPNPSHLEAVNPVVEGRVKGAQVLLDSADAIHQIAPILIHGDAALSGQGIVYETMQMYRLKGYSTGGTIHVVINNQIGFTTLPKDARSTTYCTDIARAFNAPVFHVNAEDPESCIYATYLAILIRQKFQCDVFIDLNCYRKYGHNETDEPAYTQPIEYQLIKNKKSIREIYRDHLIQQGIVERRIAEALEREFKNGLQEALDSTRFPEKEKERPALIEQKSNASKILKEMLQPVDTSVSRECFEHVGKKICVVPENFNLHRKLLQLNEDRLLMVQGKKSIDWGMGELLAYGTLLYEGISVRLAGQDSGRGTFSHRHALWMDQSKRQEYIPLKAIKKGQGRFDVYNSLLSEYAALGFEYGYNLSVPEALVLWEAQFGDFANGAQVMIDQFITSAEQKWGQSSNVVLLLPHGYEGQGPEHSSARIERFLSLCGDNNIYVVYPSTPVQLFHLLRRQMLKNLLKPLVVFTPKALLRHPHCVSQVDEFLDGKFEEILDDPNVNDASTIDTLIFCTGKIYYDLVQERKQRHKGNMAVIRIEQLYPLHHEKIKKILSNYTNMNSCFWVQEEPENMGGRWYISTTLPELLPPTCMFHCISREKSASTATGSIGRHKQEYAAIMSQLFEHMGNES